MREFLSINIQMYVKLVRYMKMVFAGSELTELWWVGSHNSQALIIYNSTVSLSEVLHVYKIVTVISAVSVNTVSECFEYDLKTHIVTGWDKK